MNKKLPMQTQPDAIIKTPIGHVAIYTQNDAVTQIDLACPKATKMMVQDPFVKHTVLELQTYFSNSKHQLDLPICYSVSSFQQKVLAILQAIPIGQTTTYGKIAKMLQTSARAVGNACRRNPLPIIIPCHRVVSQQGIGGFGGEKTGQLIDIKRWLLQHES